MYVFFSEYGESMLCFASVYTVTYALLITENKSCKIHYLTSKGYWRDWYQVSLKFICLTTCVLNGLGNSENKS